MDETIPPTRVLDYESAIHKPSLARRLMRVLGFLLILSLGAGIGLLIARAAAPVHYVSEAKLLIHSSGQQPQATVLQRYAAAFAHPTNLDAFKSRATAYGVTPQEWDQAVISTELERNPWFIRISVEHRRALVATMVAYAVYRTSLEQALNDGWGVGTVAPPSETTLLPQRDRRLIAAGGVLGAVIAVWLRSAIRRRILWRRA